MDENSSLLSNTRQFPSSSSLKVPKLALDQLSKGSSQVPTQVPTQVQSMCTQRVMETWRSLEDLPSPQQSQLNQQLASLQEQVALLVQNRSFLTQQRSEEEELVKDKISELINNLEARNLKVSEQNKKVINEALMGTAGSCISGVEELQTTNYVQLLSTISQIIIEDQDLQVQEQNDLQRELENLQCENEKLGKDIQKLTVQHETEKLSMENKIMVLEKELYREKLQGEKVSQFFESNASLGNLGQLQDWVNETLFKSIEKFLKKQNQLQQQECRVFKQTTLDLFKNNQRRNSFDTSQKFSNEQIEDPTPRFIREEQNPNKSICDFPSLSGFPKAQPLQLTSTLSSVFKHRPTDPGTQDLWKYINELEQELIDQYQKTQKQKDQSELEISVCIGASEVTKAIKSNLEAQIEELIFENEQMSRKLNGAPEKEDLIENLKGVLSPSQFKKIKEELNMGEIQDRGLCNSSLDLSLARNLEGSLEGEENIEKERFEQESMIAGQVEFITNDQKKNGGSKNSTMSFQHLQIEAGEENHNQALLSPIGSGANMFYSNQNNDFEKKRVLNNQFMLIQEENFNESFDNSSIQEQTYQPSVIVNSSIDQSQFLNTQTNKILHKLFKNDPKKEEGLSIWHNLSQEGQSHPIDLESCSFQKQDPEPTNNSVFYKGSKRMNSFFNFQGHNKNQQSLNWSKSSLAKGATGKIISQMQHNFQAQLVELKEEKMKLVSMLNDYLVQTTNNSICPDALNASSLSYNLTTGECLLNSKQEFEEFRTQVNLAMQKKELEIEAFLKEKQEFDEKKEKFQEDRVKMEEKRVKFNEKLKEYKERHQNLVEKEQKLQEKENLLLQFEKKLEFRKCALDEEWKRVDKIKHENERQHEQIQKEWSLLKKELQELGEMRKAQTESRYEIKEERCKLSQQQKIMQEKEDKVSELSLQLEEKNREIGKLKEKLRREEQTISKQKEEIKQDKDEIEKQMSFIAGERKLLDTEKNEIATKRTLSSMFIPDFKQYKSKASHQPNPSNEYRLKPKSIITHNRSPQECLQGPKILTNMNAYIKKCSESSLGCDQSGNCELHANLNNKSTISLQSLCNFHRQHQSSSIGSGRNQYRQKMEELQKKNGSSLRENSFLKYQSMAKQKFLKKNFRGEEAQEEISLILNQKIPAKMKSIEHETISSYKAGSDLQRILQNTAKFKESKNKLEQSMASLLEGHLAPERQLETQNSFLSFEGKDEQLFQAIMHGQSFSGEPQQIDE